MSNSFLRYRARSDDWQDGVERHVFGKQEYIDNGSIIKVKGTGSEDFEAEVMIVGGVGFNLKQDTDSEVFLLASSSDTHLKMALLTIPFDKQRRWPENEGGIQHPTDQEFALHFSDKLAHLTKNKFAVGEKGEFEVRGEEVYLRAKKVIIDGELHVTKVVKSTFTSGPENPPGFQGNKQAEKSGSSGDGTPTTVEANPYQLEMFADQLELRF